MNGTETFRFDGETTSVGLDSIDVSVVSHAQRDTVSELVSQLSRLHDAHIQRVIVTHNLTDDPIPSPAECSFELVQVHNDKPLGFSANHNRAFRHCTAPWFVVLNPDIEFPFGNPFPALMHAANAEPHIGAVAPTLIQPGTLLAEPLRGVVTPYEIIRRRLPGWHPPAEPAWLVGAFLLLRAEAFRALTGFDECFRLYCEDVELGIRLRQAGWSIRRLDTARVLHQTQRHSHRRIRYTLMHLASLLRLWAYLVLRRKKAGKTTGVTLDNGRATPLHRHNPKRKT